MRQTNELGYGSVPATKSSENENLVGSHQTQGLLNRSLVVIICTIFVSGTSAIVMTIFGQSPPSVELDSVARDAYRSSIQTETSYTPRHRHRYWGDVPSVSPSLHGYSRSHNPTISPTNAPSADPTHAPSTTTPEPTDGDDDFAARKAADGNASPQTIALLTSLTAVRDDSKVLVGHQHDNYIGQYFFDKEGTKQQSDVYNGTGSYPGVFGYDFMEVLYNEVNYTHHVRFAYEQGAVITFDWKADNPLTGGIPEDKTGTPCADIISGSGKAWRKWNEWLDTIADSIEFFRHVGGEPIPFIFRFLHENTGEWYWWGTGQNDKGVDTCSNSDYIALWNYTQWYLHDNRNLHNILWMYAPSSPRTDYTLAFHQRYPGDTRVDVVGFDLYTSSVSWYRKVLLEDCRAVANFSLIHNKVPAIGETGMTHGMQNVTVGEWYYTDFLKIIMEDDLCQNLAYFLTWENSHPSQYWVPLPEDLTWTGFSKLYDSDWSLFADSSTWTKFTSDYGYTTDDD